MFVGPAETMGHGAAPVLRARVFPHPFWGSCLRTGPPSPGACAQPQARLPPARVSSRVLGLNCFQLEVIHTPKRHLGDRFCSPTNVGAAALPATQASETCWILVLSGVPSTAVAHRFGIVFSRVCDLRAKNTFTDTFLKPH